MKIIIILSIAFAIGGALETYPTDFDDFDIDAVVKDQSRLLENLNCYLDKGFCEPAAAFFKNFLQDAFKHAASKCTPRQKYIFKLFLVETQKKFPKEAQEFINKYDPQGKYLPALMSALKNF